MDEIANEQVSSCCELNKLIQQVQGRTGRLVERLHIDGGGEFRGTEFRVSLILKVLDLPIPLLLRLSIMELLSV